jgi:hypothetical protein
MTNNNSDNPKLISNIDNTIKPNTYNFNGGIKPAGSHIGDSHTRPTYQATQQYQMNYPYSQNTYNKPQQYTSGSSTNHIKHPDVHFKHPCIYNCKVPCHHPFEHTTMPKSTTSGVYRPTYSGSMTMPHKPSTHHTSMPSIPPKYPSTKTSPPPPPPIKI